MRLSLRELAGNARNHLKSTMLTVSGQVWRMPLTRAESLTLLKKHQVYQYLNQDVHLPELLDPESSDVLLPDSDYELEPDYLWKVDVGNGIKSIKITRSGGVLLNNRKLLDTDFGCTAGLLDSPIKTNTLKFPLVVAPWSHFWGAYYDYMIYVVAKLCRVEKVYGPEIWQKAKICYPLLRTPFEKDILGKLQIPESALIDTTPHWKQEIEAESVITANSQPLWVPGPADIALLRERLLPAKNSATIKRRIYVARAGRRKVANEAEVVPVLKSYGFEIIEDAPRTIDEQIALFGSASVIVTPHGAGLTNLLWCSPGTQVVELFSQSYMPDYYYYLSTQLKLNYTCLIDKEVSQDENHWSNTAQDIHVNPEQLKARLEQIL